MPANSLSSAAPGAKSPAAPSDGAPSIGASSIGASSIGIRTTSEGGVLRIEFDRPEKKNAITAAMYRALAEALEFAEQDTSVRALIVIGTEDIFTAGNDIEDFRTGAPLDESSPVLQFLWQLSHAAKPIVAAVRGAAVGIGTTLLLHCDLVYAAENARFSMPFTHLGLCPEAASSLLLPQIAGYQRAAEKLLLGEAFSAEEAREMGLVNKVLPADQVLAYAEEQAMKLVALPSSSIRMTKRLMKADLSAAVEARMSLETAQFLAMLDSPEAREAFTAFLQKRKPDFKQFS